MVEKMWDAFQRGDVDAMRGVSHEDIVIVQPPELPDSRSYVGHEGVQEAVGDWPRQWEDFRLDVLESIDVGKGKVVSVTRHRGRGAASGIEVDAIIAYLLTITDDKVERIEMFTSKAQALEAAGLSGSARK